MIDTREFIRGERTALILIDLQRGIASREVQPRSGREVVGNAARLVEAFHRADLSVVFVRVSFTPQTVLKPLLDQTPAMPPPQAGWDELLPELGVRDDDVVVTKRNWGAFYGTDLDMQLRRREVKRIVIGGISTNIGVESTARDAMERNYKLLFVEDAMAAMSAQEHQHSCTVLFPRMGIVRSTDQVVQALA